MHTSLTLHSRLVLVVGALSSCWELVQASKSSQMASFVGSVCVSYLDSPQSVLTVQPRCPISISMAESFRGAVASYSVAEQTARSVQVRSVFKVLLSEMNCVSSQVLRALHAVFEVSAAGAVWNSKFNLQGVIGSQVRSVVIVFSTDSKCVSVSHTCNSAHLRSVKLVGSVASYCHCVLHTERTLQTGAPSVDPPAQVLESAVSIHPLD